MLAVALLALTLLGGSPYLMADQAEVQADRAVEASCSVADAADLTFPIVPEFDEGPTVLIPPANQIECIPGASCTADWQCGGGSRGYCKAVPGWCVCL